MEFSLKEYCAEIKKGTDSIFPKAVKAHYDNLSECTIVDGTTFKEAKNAIVEAIEFTMNNHQNASVRDYLKHNGKNQLLPEEKDWGK